MCPPAFIVEGHMEQRLIGKICPGRPVKRIGCNGDHVPIKRVCDFIETQIRLLGNRHYPIFVIFDREKRDATSQQISDEVISELEARGLGDQDVRVFVADREAEDWLLKDCDTICRIYDVQPPTTVLMGKAGLIKLIGNRVDYLETTTGVELFMAVSKKKISEKCEIFAALRASALEVGCEFFEPDLLDDAIADVQPDGG